MQDNKSKITLTPHAGAHGCIEADCAGSTPSSRMQNDKSKTTLTLSRRR